MDPTDENPAHLDTVPPDAPVITDAPAPAEQAVTTPGTPAAIAATETPPPPVDTRVMVDAIATPGELEYAHSVTLSQDDLRRRSVAAHADHFLEIADRVRGYADEMRPLTGLLHGVPGPWSVLADLLIKFVDDVDDAAREHL